MIGKCECHNNNNKKLITRGRRGRGRWGMNERNNKGGERA